MSIFKKSEQNRGEDREYKRIFIVSILSAILAAVSFVINVLT
jgi:hypothetical protein